MTLTNDDSLFSYVVGEHEAQISQEALRRLNDGEIVEEGETGAHSGAKTGSAEAKASRQPRIQLCDRGGKGERNRLRGLKSMLTLLRSTTTTITITTPELTGNVSFVREIDDLPSRALVLVPSEPVAD